MSREIWKYIKGTNKAFQVSDLGKVRSMPRMGGRYWIKGKIVNQRSSKKMSPNGYRLVTIWRYGKSQTCYVHRLVLEAFVGPCPKGMQARHFPDRDRKNNRLDNLSWATPKENHADKVVHGTTQRGENHGAAKLKRSDIPQIRRLRRKGLSYKKIGNRLGVCAQTVLNADQGRTHFG